MKKKVSCNTLQADTLIKNNFKYYIVIIVTK